MTITKRARSAEQKSERLKEILSAAEALLQERPFHRINIADVAKKAGMAKGTVFLYFKTKEELFFRIASGEFEKWFDAMDRLFTEVSSARTRPSKDKVVTTLRHILAQQPLLPRLSAILHVVLEQNIGYGEALEFKKMLAVRLSRTGALLEKCLPSFKPGQGVKFLFWMYALVIGFTHVAEPAPVVKKIFQKEPELRTMQIDFGEHFFDALGVILDGWKAQNTRRKK
jgi:AcrR family transcriptional regulator